MGTREPAAGAGGGEPADAEEGGPGRHGYGGVEHGKAVAGRGGGRREEESGGETGSRREETGGRS